MNIVSAKLFDHGYYQKNAWPKVGTLWLAALFCFLLGSLPQPSQPAKTTGRQDERPLPPGSKPEVLEQVSRFGPQDHLFFIPVSWWGVIYFALGGLYAAWAYFFRG
jgi:hypothetical protein